MVRVNSINTIPQNRWRVKQYFHFRFSGTGRSRIAMTDPGPARAHKRFMHVGDIYGVTGRLTRKNHHHAISPSPYVMGWYIDGVYKRYREMTGANSVYIAFD
jgi:hypothetical protein